MRYSLFTLVSVCIVLMPFTAQALEDPVIFYLFDSIEGNTVRDLSGFGNHGTLVDNPKIVSAKFGKGLEFDGSRVMISPSDSLTHDIFQRSFTLVVWIKPKLEGGEWQEIFRSFQAATSNDTIFINTDGRLSWRGRVGGVWAQGMCESKPGELSANKWSHVAVVGDTKNFRLYLNGSLLVESDFQKTDGNNLEYVIGGRVGGNQFYMGAVDDFAIFTVALTGAEISAIMTKGVQSAPVEPKGKLATKWAALKSDI